MTTSCVFASVFHGVIIATGYEHSPTSVTTGSDMQVFEYKEHSSHVPQPTTISEAHSRRADSPPGCLYIVVE
jgi:hypothetical protein